MNTSYVGAVLVLCFIACNSATNPDTKNMLKHPEDAGHVPPVKVVAEALVAHGHPLVTDDDKSKKSVCPDNMIHVVGEYCSNLEEQCLKWGDPDNKGVNGPTMCLEFKKPTRCLSGTIHLDYCVDKYPYPNKPEELPATNLTWYKAQELCQAEGKRLCNMKEFTQACRGPENKPYPYGYTRDCSKCNCDKEPWLDPATHSFEELDKRVTLGSMPECKSDYGVMDTVGNNDRWVENESKKPFISALKGGHAVKGARNRCSPTTLAHGPGFSFYETGAVCCKDINQIK